MPDSLTFAVDVFGAISARFADKAAELKELVETDSWFEEWLVWEAFLACKQRQTSYPFCEVAIHPTYASEGVAAEGNSPHDAGDLRVGGPNDGADHCWLFAEFVLLRDSTSGQGVQAVTVVADHLKRLGWKKSASLVIVVAANRVGHPAVGASWDQPALTEPIVIALPNGGSVVVTAFDMKQNPADTLTAAGQ